MGKQHLVARAVAALLEQPTLADAAAAAGVSERTLRRWQRDERFQRRLKAAQDELISHAVARVETLPALAVETLRFVLEQRDELAVATKAALGVLARFLRPDEAPSVTVNVGRGEPVACDFASMSPAEREVAVSQGNQIDLAMLATLPNEQLIALHRAACRASAQ